MSESLLIQEPGWEGTQRGKARKDVGSWDFFKKDAKSENTQCAHFSQRERKEEETGGKAPVRKDLGPAQTGARTASKGEKFHRDVGSKEKNPMYKVQTISELAACFLRARGKERLFSWV